VKKQKNGVFMVACVFARASQDAFFKGFSYFIIFIIIIFLINKLIDFFNRNK
jgi:hypothetical protein